jgi:hypothetical protein
LTSPSVIHDLCSWHELVEHLQALRYGFRGEKGHARNVSPWPVQARYQTGCDRISPIRKHDRDRRSRGFCCERRRGAADGSDHHHLTANQVFRQRCQPIILALCKAVFDPDILALDIASLRETLPERDQETCRVRVRPGAEKPNGRHCALLRPRRERPACRGAAEQRDELPAAE